MLTRGMVQRNFEAPPVPRTNIPGWMRTQVSGGISQTWAIARPNSSPESMGGPVFVTGLGTYKNPGAIVRGGMMPLSPTKPNLEMDPSDSSTWQRKYYFS